MTFRSTDIEVKSIVGPWPFAIAALGKEDIEFFIQRSGGGRIEGRMPTPGEPEALVSEPLARNLGKRLGDNLLEPDIPEAFSPLPVKIVGVIHTSEWKAVIPLEYHQNYHFPPIDSLLFFTQDPRDQRQFDLWVEEHLKGQNARVFTYAKLEEQADTMFNILYQILNVVIGLLVIVITIMMGMLINIHLSQRVQEFGLLQALGYTKKALLTRVLAETSVVVIGGWVIGIFVSWGLLEGVKKVLMDPRAFALDTTDRLAMVYTLPVPITIFIVILVTIGVKFKKFDPVGVVERRLV
jgi:putative ABC transport system permease protein/lipoprotein-releasing system permease protein